MNLVNWWRIIDGWSTYLLIFIDFCMRLGVNDWKSLALFTNTLAVVIQHLRIRIVIGVFVCVIEFSRPISTRGFFQIFSENNIFSKKRFITSDKMQLKHLNAPIFGNYFAGKIGKKIIFCSTYPWLMYTFTMWRKLKERH